MTTRILNVLTNFSTAVSIVQSAKLMCDTFTVLLRTHDHLELRHIEMKHVRDLMSRLTARLRGDTTEQTLEQCVQSAEQILQGLTRMTLAPTLDTGVQLCALAAQFLCVAFLSYIRAHVGPLDPFFLDTPQRKMILLGSQRTVGDLTITAELVNLTCLAEVTQGPVFAFHSGRTHRDSQLNDDTSARYEVRANMEDFIDTWGPARLIHSNSRPNEIYGIDIRGGVVTQVDRISSRYHWIRGGIPQDAPGFISDPHTIMRIGAAVDINQTCHVDEATYGQHLFSPLEPLG